MKIYLAIDLGTTGCRSILFDESLNQLAAAYEEYGLITPREKWTEQDAELWWEMTLRTAAEAIKTADIDSRQIEGISISSQGITIVPVDENIRPLCNAMSWLDVRSEEQCALIGKDFGGEYIFTHTGKENRPSYSLPKILWLRDNQPDIYEKAWKFLMPMEFLIAKFTGNCVTDHSMASGTLMYDIKNLRWSNEILDRYGIREDQLPTICWGGESAGCVLPEVAAKLGLREDCVVAVGAQDQKCAAYGAGLADGVMTISLGTAAAITKRWNEPKTREHRGIGWCGYVEPGTWVTEGVIGTAGTCLRWVRDMLFSGESYDIINEEALQARERGSSVLFYPHLNGFYPNPEGTFYGVNLATNRGDFALAVMEGVAFQIRSILEQMDAYGNVHTLVLFGGGAKSPVWRQIIADVTGMQLRVPVTPEAASAGAAMLAAKAAGNILPGLQIENSYEPSENSELYKQKYRKFKTIEKKLWSKEGAK